jgi:hypothetical protein
MQGGGWPRLTLLALRSGHFVASPTLWASAHTTQFTRHGMRYLPQGRGSGELTGGGTYVSFVDPVEGDLTIVIETAGPNIGSFCNGNCNGHCMYTPASAVQTVSFRLSNVPLPNTTKALQYWRTLLQQNSSESQLFERQSDIAIVNGCVTVNVEPDSIVTLSTVRTATKAGNGELLKTIPASSPFPLPYSDRFETSRIASAGRYWSDMEGGFEIGKSGIHKGNNRIMKQTVTHPACCNFISSLDGPLPLSIIGSSVWEDIRASIAISIPSTGGYALFGARAKFAARSFFKGGLGKPSGIFAAIDEHGWQLLPSVAAAATGLSWPPAAASGCLASGAFSTPGAGVWRPVTLVLANRTLSYAIDGADFQTVTLPPGVATGEILMRP